MSRKPVSSVAQVPYAELVIRPADSRPVVVWMMETGAEAELSAGTAADAVEAEVVLSLMLTFVRTYRRERDSSESVAGELNWPGEGSDDIPF